MSGDDGGGGEQSTQTVSGDGSTSRSSSEESGASQFLGELIEEVIKPFAMSLIAAALAACVVYLVAPIAVSSPIEFRGVTLLGSAYDREVVSFITGCLVFMWTYKSLIG